MNNIKNGLMKSILLTAFIFGSACQSEKKEIKDINVVTDTITAAEPTPEPVAEPVETFENARFKEVTASRVNDTTFRIRGKAQIFEANFGWHIEDGHNILNKGNEMTDAGAPEWGNFDFTVLAKKDRPNSTLLLILYESSAKDGSNQHELPIFLK